MALSNDNAFGRNEPRLCALDFAQNLSLVADRPGSKNGDVRRIIVCNGCDVHVLMPVEPDAEGINRHRKIRDRRLVAVGVRREDQDRLIPIHDVDVTRGVYSQTRRAGQFRCGPFDRALRRCISFRAWNVDRDPAGIGILIRNV